MDRKLDDALIPRQPDIKATTALKKVLSAPEAKRRYFNADGWDVFLHNEDTTGTVSADIFQGTMPTAVGSISSVAAGGSDHLAVRAYQGGGDVTVKVSSSVGIVECSIVMYPVRNLNLGT